MHTHMYINIVLLFIYSQLIIILLYCILITYMFVSMFARVCAVIFFYIEINTSKVIEKYIIETLLFKQSA